MKFILIIASLFLFCIFILGCKGDQGPTGPVGQSGSFDKQIRLDFGYGGISTSDTAGKFSSGMSNLLKFKKSDYVDVDSIVFVTSVGVESPASMVIQLYDLTDSLYIPNAQITTTQPWETVVQTGNIFNDLPDKDIDIAIHIRTTIEGKYVQTGSAVLFLYRR